MNFWIGISIGITATAIGQEWGAAYGWCLAGLMFYGAEMADKFIEAYRDSFEDTDYPPAIS